MGRQVDLGISALMFDREDADRFWAIVQGVGLFETTDYAQSWSPRNRGLRADWPREHEEVGFCVHKLVRSPVDGDRMYRRTHVGMHRSYDDAGLTWTEITEGLPTEFGFAAATHPHDRDTFYVIPLDPVIDGDPGRPRGRLADARCRLELATPGPRAAAARRACRRLARGDGGRFRGRTGSLLRDEHRAGLCERQQRRLVDADCRLPPRRSPRSRSLRSSNGGRPSPVDAGAALPGAAATGQRAGGHRPRRDRLPRAQLAGDQDPSVRARTNAAAVALFTCT